MIDRINRIKDKSFDHSNTCRIKYLTKCNTSVIRKILDRLEIEENLLSLVKDIWKPPDNITLNCKRLKAFPLRSERRQVFCSCHFYST